MCYPQIVQVGIVPCWFMLTYMYLKSTTTNAYTYVWTNTVRRKMHSRTFYSLFVWCDGGTLDTNIVLPDSLCTLNSHCMNTHVHMNYQSLRQGKAKQLCLKTTPFFPREKEELPQVGFKPATFCILGRCSTNYMYLYTVYCTCTSCTCVCNLLGVSIGYKPLSCPSDILSLSPPCPHSPSLPSLSSPPHLLTPVISGIPVLNSKVIALDVQLQKGEDEFFFDELPNNPAVQHNNTEYMYTCTSRGRPSFTCTAMN